MLWGVGLYVFTGFFLLPALVKWQLRQQLPALTHRQTEVKQVRMNPFTLSLTIRGLSLTETNGTPFAACDEFYANFELSSLFHWAWTFDEIHLIRPTANLVRLRSGDFNFSNLLSTNAATTSAPPAVLIRSLWVTNAVVTVTDELVQPAFHTAYGPINVNLTDFTTYRDAEEPYTFAATTGEGETFSWSGRFSLRQLRSSGQFKLTGIPPQKYAPYLANFTTVQIQRGALDFGASYQVNAARTPLELEVTNATVAVRDLRVQAPERNDTLLTIDHLQVTDAAASLTGMVARVGGIRIDGGAALLERDTNGQPVALGYLKLPKTEEAPVAMAALHAMGYPWQFQLDALSLANFQVAVEDHSTDGVAELGLEHLALDLKDLSNRTNAPLALAVGFDWRGGGAARVETSGTVLPLNLAATIVVSNLALPPVQPYLGQYLNLTVHSGAMNVQGRAQFNPAGAPQLQFTGDVSVTDFSSSDTISHHELARWENHSVRGIDFSLNPSHLAIEEIKFVGARNNIVISSNGQINVVALAKLPAHTNAAPVAAPKSQAWLEQFPIRVGAVVLERNSLRAVDDTLLRRFETQIEEINGSIRNLVLPGSHQTDVNLHGKISALAPFEIVGAVTPDPDHLFVALKIACTNTDLTAFSPYAEKFVGRPLTKGKLTTELRYHIEQRQLAASNVVDVAQLTLGGRVESPSATKLPVKLAVGLLKDMDGHIILDVPLSGSLDDPQFSVWKLVGQTLQNLILKVATSPFSLLGSLVGGGAEMQFVDFDPGQTRLNDSQTNKLFKLATALNQRPGLTLEIGATFDPALDVEALGRQKVGERMKVLYLEELAARRKPTPPLSEVRLDDADYDRLLGKAYRAAFNTTPEQTRAEKLTNAPGATASREPQKGAAILQDYNQSLAQIVAATQTAAGGTNAVAAARPKTEKELIRDELEQRLATLAPVTAEDLRILMQQRIAAAQKFLVEQAAIPADRVAPTATNPEDPNRKGSARVVFSLD